jgi:hypothetical protein
MACSENFGNSWSRRDLDDWELWGYGFLHCMKNPRESGMHISVNVQTNSLSKLSKCKGGLVSVFCKIDGWVDVKRRPW